MGFVESLIGNGFAMGFYVLIIAFACFMPLLILRPRSGNQLPPSPPGLPILGHLHLLGPLPHQSMARLAKKYGEIYAIRLGSVPAIVVTTPKLAKEFLQTHDKIWASRSTRNACSFYFSYNHSGIALGPYTPVWRRLRKLCTLELFTPRRMDASRGLREEEMRLMIRSVASEHPQPLDFKLKMNALTANVVSRIVLNKRLTLDQETEGQQEFKDIIEELFVLQGAFVIGDYVSWLRKLDLGGTVRRMKTLRVRLDAFLDEILRDHQEKRDKGLVADEEMDMVDVLLREMHTQDPDETQRIDINNVKSTILNMFAGGTDTSTVTMEWAMSELLRHPHTLKRLQAELDAAIGKSRLVRESDIPNLPFLQAVIKETFRLHPVGPLLVPHESTRACDVAGFRIPAGTRLYVNTWAIGRDPGAWERPLEFDPERFMTEDVDVKGQDFRLLPFGSGRRGCPGLPLGLLIVQCAMATLVHAFDWSLPVGEVIDEMNMAEAFGLTVPRANALFAVATPRLDATLY